MSLQLTPHISICVRLQLELPQLGLQAALLSHTHPVAGGAVTSHYLSVLANFFWAH